MSMHAGDAGRGSFASKESSKGKELSDDSVKSCLPTHLFFLRKNIVLILVSNLSFQISQPKLEAMFSKVGHIVDSFIPTSRKSCRKRGFAHLCFGIKEEANMSWGGRKIQLNLAC